MNKKYPLIQLHYEKLQKCKTWEEWKKCMLMRSVETQREAYWMMLEREAAANGGKLKVEI